MPFNRPPRLRRIIQSCEVEIPQPPEIPTKPTINWLSVILPMILISVIYGALALYGGDSFNSSYLFFLPMMLLSGSVAIINYFSQTRIYNKKKEEALSYYSKQLELKRNELDELFRENQRIAVGNNPSPQICYKAVQDEDLRLGERRPEDDDFLSIRIGEGSIDSGITVTVHEGKLDEAFDPFIGTAKAYQTKYAELDDAPITFNLRELGCVGIYGESDLTLKTVSAIAMQIFTHHWLAEVKVTLLCRLRNYDYWKWMKNVPHRSEVIDAKISPIVVIDKMIESSEAQLSLLEDEVRRRKTYVTSTGGKDERDKFPALVFIIDHISDIYDYPTLEILLHEGRELNVFGIFIYDQLSEIPGECNGVIEVSQNNLKLALACPQDKQIDEIIPDQINDINFEKFANKLENIPWLIPSEVSGPPAYVPLLDLFDTPDVNTLAIDQWWQESSPWGYFRTPIGKYSQEKDFILDLNEGDLAHGPHGFIGGTTGSGKSELLKSIILSYAMTHSPNDISFALIDYKGGATFKEFEGLPHVVGVITDIESHENYARRVILALEGEVQRRKQILLDAKEEFDIEANYNQYHDLKVKQILPRLVIIFDEFAEFKDQHPEESKSLINLARQGRSLGIHLLLCTQNPGVAVDKQVRQNSRFRICLRVASEDDSIGVVGVRDAWQLPTGRALFRVNNIFEFQGAYPEAPHYQDERIIRIRDNGQREIVFSEKTPQKEEKQSRAIVEKIKRTARELKIRPIPRIWPNPLPEKLFLPDILFEESISTPWNGKEWVFNEKLSPLVLGKFDDPEHQIQPAYRLPALSDTDNHLIVVGNSGSGKSLLLLTTAYSIAQTRSPQEAYIYCIDFSANRTLDCLEILPHVPRQGGIIYGEDTERIDRLFNMLKLWNQERQTEFRKQGVINFAGYNEKNPNNRMPEIYILVDGITGQVQMTSPEFAEQLDEIVRIGSSSGFNVILSANNYRDVPNKVLKSIRNRIFLGKAETGQIESIIEQPPSFYKDALRIVSGRGLWNNNPVMEFQAALPVVCKNWDDGYSVFIKELESMQAAWNGRENPPDILKLPSQITLRQMMDYPKDEVNFPTSKYSLPVGISGETLMQVGFSLEDDSIIMIASNAAQSGKSSILQAWIKWLSENYNKKQLKLFLVDFINRNRDFRNIKDQDNVFQYVGIPSDFNESLDCLEKEIERRKKILDKLLKTKGSSISDGVEKMGLLLIVIDNFGNLQLTDEKGHDRLAKCVLDGEDVGVRVVLAENVAQLGKGDIAKRAKNKGTGLLLGGSENLDLFNDTKLSKGSGKTFNLPAGRGYLVKNGNAQLIQTAMIKEDQSQELRK